MELWPHQERMVAFARPRSGAVFDAGMGTGKTAAALATLIEREATSAVVLCPSAVVGVWPREIEKHAPGRWAVFAPRHGTVKAKTEQLRNWLRLQRARGVPHLAVFNYEAAWRAPLGAELMKHMWDALVLDEGHRIKAPGGKASRFAGRLGTQARFRLALSGTVCPHSPLDIYGLARAVDPRVFGRSFVAFRSKYALVDPRFPSKVWRWLNQDDYRERFARLAITVKSEDVLDLPPITDQIVEVDLSAQARRTYDELERDLYARVDAGEITAANGLVKLLRLQQLTGGWATLDDGTLSYVCDAKRKALEDVLRDVGEPVVVFGRFAADLEAVRTTAATLGRRYGEISGARKDGLSADAEMADVDVLGVQIQSGGTGIDLTRARLAIYYSTGFSLGDFEQSRARLHRPGQERHVHLIHIAAAGTIDMKVLRALRERREVIDSVLYGDEAADVLDGYVDRLRQRILGESDG